MKEYPQYIAVRLVVINYKSMQPEASVIDPEDFRYVIADELDKALSGLRVQSLTLNKPSTPNDDAEAKYGDKLDRLLGNLEKR